jgi:RNA polymerase sigma-70 factor (ECF subfamily)
VDALRTTKNRTRIIGEALRLKTVTENAIEEKYFESGIIELLYAKINELPERTRKVFTLTYLEGYTRKEVAQMMDLSENTVRNMNQSAMKTLRLAFADDKLIVLLFMIAGASVLS